MSVTSGGTAPKPFSSSGSWSASAGSAGIVITFLIAQSAPSRCHSQTEADRSSTETTTPTNPYALRGSCAGRSSSTIWCCVAEVERLLVAALAQIPDVHVVAVLAAEQLLGDDAVLEHRGVPHSLDSRVS